MNGASGVKTDSRKGRITMPNTFCSSFVLDNFKENVDRPEHVSFEKNYVPL